MIIGISGLSGSGKDTLADMMVKEYDFVKIGIADPMKRICKKIYDFSDEQLWGPSEKRNSIDKRYPRTEHVLSIDSTNCQVCGIDKNFINMTCYLTPRYALQILGDWGVNCYCDTWSDIAVHTAQELLKDRKIQIYYSHKSGLHYEADGVVTVQSEIGKPPPYRAKGVVIPDVRLKSDMHRLRKAKAKFIRIKRSGKNPRWNHPSETKQLEIPDSEFDQIIINDGSESDLRNHLKKLMS